MNLDQVIQQSAESIAGYVKQMRHQVTVDKRMGADRLLGVLSPKARGQVFWYRIVDPATWARNRVDVTFSCVDGSREEAVVVPSRMKDAEAVEQITNHFMQEYATFLQAMGR
jgi:hypothetical protein